MRPGVKDLVRTILDKMRAGERLGLDAGPERGGPVTANCNKSLADDREFDHKQRGDDRAT